MPNWCYNALYIIGKKSVLEKLKEEVKNGDAPFSFRKIIPPPDVRILDTNDGYNGKIEGLPSGYDWCYENWGTKWDAAEVILEEGKLTELVPWMDDVESDDAYLKYEFDTAWSPPEPVLIALRRKYPELEYHMHSEESGMGFIIDYDVTADDFEVRQSAREASWYDSVITGVRGG